MASDASVDVEAEVEWLGLQLETLHPKLTLTPARPCAACQDWFIPDESTTNNVCMDYNVCMDCRNEHHEPSGDYC